MVDAQIFVDWEKIPFYSVKSRGQWHGLWATHKLCDSEQVT